MKEKILPVITKLGTPGNITPGVTPVIKPAKKIRNNYICQSYRWRTPDLDKLNRIKEKIQKATGRKFMPILILRGCLEIADKLDPETIIQAIGEAEKEKITY